MVKICRRITLKLRIFYFPLFNLQIFLDDCGSGISDDCQMEWDDKESEEKFYERCDSEGGSNPLRWRCSLCCPGMNYIWFKCSKQFTGNIMENICVVNT